MQPLSLARDASGQHIELPKVWRTIITSVVNVGMNLALIGHTLGLRRSLAGLFPRKRLREDAKKLITCSNNPKASEPER
jgi:hypothetical protein